MEQVLELITINSTANSEIIPQIQRSMNHNSYPFLICDIPFLQCITGFVYFLIRLKRKMYTYIGTTQFLRERLSQHNSGYGYQINTP